MSFWVDTTEVLFKYISVILQKMHFYSTHKNTNTHKFRKYIFQSDICNLQLIFMLVKNNTFFSLQKNSVGLMLKFVWGYLGLENDKLIFECTFRFYLCFMLKHTHTHKHIHSQTHTLSNIHTLIHTRTHSNTHSQVTHTIFSM